MKTMHFNVDILLLVNCFH